MEQKHNRISERKLERRQAVDMAEGDGNQATMLIMQCAVQRSMAGVKPEL
jgi:hypothetical protein